MLIHIIARNPGKPDDGIYPRKMGVSAMEGLCRARLANASAALEFGDLNEATKTLSPLWRCSAYSDCRLRQYCAVRVQELTDRICHMPPVAKGNN